jgi:hypothetical protein
MEKEEEVVLDSEVNYSLKSPFLKGEVAKDHVNRCLIAMSKEMKKGYFNSSISNSGEEIKEYIQDTRKAFISSVKGLKALLYPEILEDLDIKKSLVDLEKDEEKVFNKYCYNERQLKDNKLIKTGINYIPEEDAPLWVRVTNKDGSKGYDKRKGVWNDYVGLYWENLVNLYEEVFAILNLLMHNLDYFNPESAGY